MSASHPNTKSMINDIIRDYAKYMTSTHVIFKEAQSDFKNHVITTQQLIEIMIRMFANLSRKYTQIARAIEVSEMKQIKIDMYLHLANLIKYFDEKSIDTDVYSIEQRVVESLLSCLHETIDLYMNALNLLANNDKNVLSLELDNKRSVLSLTLPCQSIIEDLKSPERSEIDSTKCVFNFNVDSRDASFDVPSYSPTEGLSPATSDTEDEPPLSPKVDHLIPDWQDFLNERIYKYYTMGGGEQSSSGCQEYFHLFLGGRRLSSLQTPTTPEQSITTAIENEPVLFRRTAGRRLWDSTASGETNNILLAEEDVDKYIVFKTSEEDAVVQYAELDVLIVYATNNLQSGFCDTFLSTHRSFVSTEELIEKLIYRFKTCTDKYKYIKKTSFALLIKACKASTRCAITQELLTSLVKFIHHLVGIGEIEWVFELHKIFEQKTNEYHKTKMWINALPEYLDDNCNETILDFKAITIAQQMTLMAYDLFTKIDVPELLVSEAKNETPNVTAFIHHCDKLSYWVTTIIGKLRSREVQKYIKYLVTVMKYLKEYRDYSSCWAILIGLQTTYIYKITKKYEYIFNEFIELFSFSGNYRNYRTELKESKLPRIPLICIALHDLIYISEATKRFKPSELENSINFYRIWRQYKYIKVFKEEKSGYPFKKNGKVLMFLRNFENHLHHLSADK